MKCSLVTVKARWISSNTYYQSSDQGGTQARTLLSQEGEKKKTDRKRGENPKRTKLDAPPVSSRRKRWRWQQLVLETLSTSTHQFPFHSQPVWLQLGMSEANGHFTTCYSRQWPTMPMPRLGLLFLLFLWIYIIAGPWSMANALAIVKQ